jgi:HSP20 family molecular chaperone IbpA
MVDIDEKNIDVQEKNPANLDGADSLSGGPSFQPALDIWEDSNGITIEAEMPGVDADGLSIDLTNKTLTIQGKVIAPQAGTKRFLKREFEVGDFYHRITITGAIDQENIIAKIKDGVLVLFLPKPAPAETKKIKVVTE